MPLKRGRSALDAASQIPSASSSSSANGSSLGSASANTSQSEIKPAGFLKRSLNGLVSALSPSNKRPKTNADPESHGHLLLTSSIMPSNSSSPTPPERQLLTSTPTKLASAAAAADTTDTPSSLQSHEVAIRDPLGRTFKVPSPSTSSAVITDTRSSSEEAAEVPLQQNTSPPSSPSLPVEPFEPSHDAESISTTAAESVQAETSTANSIATRAEATIPTDEDVEHIQAIADAKVGEHIEGLIDWNGHLSMDEPQPSSASDFDIDQVTTDASKPDDKTASLHRPADDIVDLVSDSEESGSDKEDPDKENDMSLASATPRLDSNSGLEPLASQDALAKPSRSSQSRYSLAGPMAHKSLYKYRQDRQSTSGADSSFMSNSLEAADTTATEMVNSIGRQTRFVQPGRRSIQHGSTPLRPERPSAPDRSASFSSNVSNFSATTPARVSHDSLYRKRNPIYSKKHLQQVSTHNRQSMKRAIEQALTRMRRLRLSGRKIDPSQKLELAAKTFKVHQLVAEDNVNDARGDLLKALAQRYEYMRQKQRDAETAILPLPQVKLLERERLRREEKAKWRKLRRILGRKELPDTLGVEEEQAVTSVFSKRGVISEITGAAVSDADVQKLRPRQWLNDEVINFYGALILIRANEADKKRTQAIAAAKDAPAEADGKPNGKGGKGKPKRPYDESLDAFWRVHYFSSFFWSNLKSKGFDGVKRWTRRIDIFSKDLILFPINLGNAHWVCGVINMRKHRFEYYDSMGAHNQAAFNLMRTYLTEEARDKKKKEIDLRGWKDVFSDDSPQQENSYDCGVFAAQTLEQVSRRDPHTPIPLEAPRVTWKGESLDEGAGKLSIGGAGGDDSDDEGEEYEWNFGQQNMPYLRRRMAYEIYSKHLLD
ncbi:Ulp1 protease [Pseudozyma hubeiensis SY62]|uniref:Ulp1 protease n=1 Tax=Pseudozyma hubeiensis (strain SY62) TaxID=1305764 RepID=R9PBS6_PSEHS|nr:Ulp1 protease [Pseudozyma hubeiensis SY62]GAC95540.1 Ulp1 protease [Pseudozyma hubeiensis SY62]